MKRNPNFIFSLLTALLLFPIASQAECQYEERIEAASFQVGIMLTWKTDYEKNHERFVIEKSEDGLDFTEIGTVTGKGTTDERQNYNFLHIYPRENRIYYRLKEIDFGGVISYSDIAVFETETPAEVRIVRLSDSFTTSEFSVKLDSYSEGELTYILKDWQGEVLLTEKKVLPNGLIDVAVDAKELPVGIYKLALFKDEKPIDVLTFKRTERAGENKTPMVRKN